jgi:hypothetical protein
MVLAAAFCRLRQGCPTAVCTPHGGHLVSDWLLLLLLLQGLQVLQYLVLDDCSSKVREQHLLSAQAPAVLEKKQCATLISGRWMIWHCSCCRCTPPVKLHIAVSSTCL